MSIYVIMKEFMKVLGLAIVGTALIMGIAAVAAGVLRSYNREVVSCILLSIVGISMIAPLFVLESKKEWVIDVAIFCMAFFPIQCLTIAMFL